MKHRSRTNRQNKNDGWDGRKSAAAAALTLAHTLNSQLSLSHTLRDNSADVDVAVAALYNTVTFVLFIFSFRLLAWRFLIARISFHFISISFRFRQRAHSLSLSLSISLGRILRYEHRTRLHIAHIQRTHRQSRWLATNKHEWASASYLHICVVCVPVCAWEWALPSSSHSLTPMADVAYIYKWQLFCISVRWLPFFVSLC